MSAQLDVDPGDPTALFDQILSLSASGAAQAAVGALHRLGASALVRRTLRRNVLLWARGMLSASRLEEAYAATCVLQALEAADITTRTLCYRVKWRRLA